MTKDFFHQSLSFGIKHRKYPKLFKHLQHQTEQREKAATERLQFENLSVFFQPNAAKYMWMKTVGAAEAKGNPLYTGYASECGLLWGAPNQCHEETVLTASGSTCPSWRYNLTEECSPRCQHTCHGRNTHGKGCWISRISSLQWHLVAQNCVVFRCIETTLFDVLPDRWN